MLRFDCRHLVYLDHIVYFYWLLDINVASRQLHQIQQVVSWEDMEWMG